MEESKEFEAEALFRWLSRAEDSVEVGVLTQLANGAWEGGGRRNESNQALREASEALEKARRRHTGLEEAASELVLLAGVRPIDEYAAVNVALGAARQVWREGWSWGGGGMERGSHAER